MKDHVKVTFQPNGRTVWVLPETLLLEAAGRAGITIDTPCGGTGTCSKCRVRVIAGTSSATKKEQQTLAADQLAAGERLACQCRVQADMTVEIPNASLFRSDVRVLTSEAAQTHHAASRKGVGLAVDLGTTTLVATLVDLISGHDLAVAGAVNPQTAYGDDVISRVKHCVDHTNGLATLNTCIINGINELVRAVAQQANIVPDQITEAVFAGNTAMQQIFCKIDPSGLAQLPFSPAFTDLQQRTPEELGLNIATNATCVVFPQIGGFVGGDAIAGLLATGLDTLDGPALFLDVGTNGELVLWHKHTLTATSMAAGPAFEGARIHHGMRAAPGAIEKVVFNHDIEINVIGNTPPAGLCGSALIDAAAGMLDVGILDNTGRLLDPGELDASVPEAIRRRLGTEAGQGYVELAGASDTATGEAIRLHQKDIRELQLANGAIRAGIKTLLETNNLKPADLQALFVAGGFGNFIRRSHAKRIGLLPDMPNERIRFVGNTASLGARRAVLSPDERDHAQTLRDRTTHVDLSSSPTFQETFSDGMLFP